MSRHTVRVLVVAGLLAIGWVGGRAQSSGADFELTVSASPNGAAQVTCIRGCSLTWGNDPPPNGGPVEILVPGPTLKGTINSDAPQGCLAPSWWPKNCRIWGFAKR